MHIDDNEIDRLDVDHGTNNAQPLPRYPTSAQLAGGHWWNATTQELIPILGPDHPDYLRYRERISEALKRWDRGEA